MESIEAITGSRDVKVQIGLEGGHQHTLSLASDSPLLHDLFSALASQGRTNTLDVPKFFQLPLDGGRSACSFSSTQLVSVITEPPVLIEVQEGAGSQHPGWVIPSTYLQFDGFLTPDEQEQLLAYALQQEAAFKPGTVSTNEADYRESKVQHDIADSSWGKLFRERLRVYLPQVLRRLNKAPFTIDSIEAQLTAHNEGDYFKVHNDAGDDADMCREVTYVYYFYQEPKQFSGGELLLYDSTVENNVYVRTESCRVIEPRNNSLIFFLSFAHHEVLPIRCPSRDFSDSRFTVNGWVRREPRP